MANATKKITLATARDISFDKLSLSQANVRRIKAGISVEELAESIARRGLIQSLHVRPLLDEAGAETGRYEVPAGGRRFRALELLVKQKRLPKTAPVPCIVSEASSGILIDEVSLAENIERAPLHPLDQFRAFLALRDKGMTEAEIAAAFFVTPQVVKQRLRLTAVAPALLEVYAEDAMTLEQLMAFTVSDDHDRQVQVWEAVRQSWQKEPWQIRRMLTEQAVRAGDRRARFVGLEAYVEAGGAVMRDLFEEDGGGWLQDVPLLERLVAEKLSAKAEAIAAEGWKWVEVATDFPYGHTHGLRRLTGTTVDLTEAERTKREALREEYDALEAEYEGAEEFPDAVDARLAEIEAALEAFNSRPLRFEPDQMARAGAFVSLRSDGTLSVARGYVRPEDEEPVEPVASAPDSAMPEAAAPQPVITTPWQAPAEEEDDGIRPLTELINALPTALQKCLAYFAGVDRSLTGYEGLIAAQECIPNNDLRDAFAADFSVLARIWEALSPDPVLTQYETDYRWLAQVYESLKPSSGTGRLLWHRLGAKTIELIHENVHVDAVRDDLDTLVLDAELLEAVLGNPDPEKKAKEISVKLAGRLRKHAGNSKFKALGERLEDLKNRHQQGLLLSIDFLKELLALAKDVVKTERETPEEEDIDRGKAALTELFEEARNGDTPVMVKRVVDDIDAIVREVRFEGWQATHAGEREVKKALRQTLFKLKLHQDAELFERAYGYIRSLSPNRRVLKYAALPIAMTA